MSQVEPFGFLRDGSPVHRYTLTGPGPLTARILNYGATLSELHVPDRKGRLQDVVLGHPDVETYEASHDYLGAVVGRIAGRVNRGRISVSETDFALVTNEPPHHVNGGIQGLGKRVWDVVDAGEDEVRLRYVSPDGEEGYPGNLEVEVTYRITSRGELHIELTATTDRPTPVTLCPHIGFNLSGGSEKTIDEHRICLFSHEVATMEKDLTFTGEFMPVEEAPCDLNVQNRMGDIIGRLVQHHGEMYRIQRSRKHDLVPAARLEHLKSGRIVHIATTQPFIQLYTGCRLPADCEGKNGRPNEPFSGIWMNCQGYPNGTIHPGIDNLILKPSGRYNHKVVYGFDTLEA